MKTILKRYFNNKYTKKLFYIIFNFLVSDKTFLKIKYKRTFDRKLNLKNPVTFNAKLQWKKLYDRNNFYTICADKYKVRDYIKEKIGEQYLIPLLFVGENSENIPFKQLKTPYIIKANHSSGRNIIVWDKNELNERKIINNFNKWLKEDWYLYFREWHYKDIKPLIIVEKLLLDKNGKIPTDYKFHCFNGKVEFIQVNNDRFIDLKSTILDKNWQMMPFKYVPGNKSIPFYKSDDNIKKPKNLNEMISVAEKLSSCFDYVRVDLYSVNNQIYTGELTLSPGAGFTRFYPDKYDYIFGGKLKLN